jgi:hypothetical protein
VRGLGRPGGGETFARFLPHTPSSNTSNISFPVTRLVGGFWSDVLLAESIPKRHDEFAKLKAMN